MSHVLPFTAAPRLALAYLRFGVRKPERWSRFAQQMLGLPEPCENADGSLGFRIDDAAQRLVISEDPADDLSALGLECGDDKVLDELLRRLAHAGIGSTPGDAALCRARRVQRLNRVFDPEGNAVELCVGLERVATPFVSEAFPGGFRAGALGLGHAVLVSHDIAAMERFYVDLLGFGVSERLDTRFGPIAMRGSFLHCNRRHHSIALFDLPLRKKLHHFMLQANAIADVGAAFERAERNKVPLSLELGQHPDPDGTFSFYGETPSGFDFEIGAGGKEIEPQGWREGVTGPSLWGHKPRLRLQLKMVGELLASKIAA